VPIKCLHHDGREPLLEREGSIMFCAWCGDAVITLTPRETATAVLAEARDKATREICGKTYSEIQSEYSMAHSFLDEEDEWGDHREATEEEKATIERCGRILAKVAVVVWEEAKALDQIILAERVAECAKSDFSTHNKWERDF
jgi:uncharacterized Zn finger protein (UPF0148 family)